MIRWLLALLALPATAFAVGAPPSCPVTVGSITLTVSQPRTSGISPFLAFFDATGSTSTQAAHSNFQDIYFVWDFGDTSEISGGTQFWAYGATGQPRKNKATGPVAAHLYVLPIDQTSAQPTATVQVWAYDGASVATCTVNAAALAPSGVSGFPTSDTTCVAHGSLPAANIGGCPASAGVYDSTSGTLSDVFGGGRLGNGKRVLLKCGDTFTGAYNIGSALTTASIGAYGDCVNTGAGRPILSNSTNGTNTLNLPSPEGPTDVRIADLDFEATGTNTTNAIYTAVGIGQRQLTLYNLNCSGHYTCFGPNGASQSGLIASSADVSPNPTANYAVFWNFAANNCVNGATGANCSGGSRSTCGGSFTDGAYCDVRYNAIIGNSVTGPDCVRGGACSTGAETSRYGACRMCVFTNNTFHGSTGNWGSNFKLFSGNTWSSQATWVGQYTEYVEISDNIFTGRSGPVMVETAPENNIYDERLRYIIFERNYIKGTAGAVGQGLGATKMLVSAQNETIRNNVWFIPASDNYNSNYNMEISRRPQSSVSTWPVQAIEVYNNTCYGLTAGTTCVGFVTVTADQAYAAGINSWASNNLYYNNGSAGTTVNNAGTGNTVSNNSANGTANPAISNITGSYLSILDFRPSANAGGATSGVPNFFDAYQLSWGTKYQLGALSPAAP